MQKAMKYEFERQVDLIERGEKVIQETRRFNADTGETAPMRGKEDAHDYRYFREPDLVTIKTSKEEIEKLREALPELPDSRRARYIDKFGLSAVDADIIVKYRKVAEFFDSAATKVQNPKTVSNFIISQIYRTLSTDELKENFNIKVSAKDLAALIRLLESKKSILTLQRQPLIR